MRNNTECGSVNNSSRSTMAYLVTVCATTPTADVRFKVRTAITDQTKAFYHALRMFHRAHPESAIRRTYVQPLNA